MHEHMQHPMNTEPLPDYKTGTLPPRAPLAVPFVPFQDPSPPQYSPEEALTRGTLFPGLDLPFMNTVNQTNPLGGTALGEIMALSMAVMDLHLYLDTHPDDAEATRIFKHYNELLATAKKYYVAKFGPLTLADAVQDGRYAWLDDPWPWDYQEGGA